MRIMDKGKGEGKGKVKVRDGSSLYGFWSEIKYEV